MKKIFVYIFLFFLTALVLDLANPFFDKPSRDGGFFLYAGQQILDGKIPYRDFWDSKGPAIFYINALGLLLGSGSRWGVWMVEFVFMFFTFFVLYRVLTKHWATNTALLGIAVAGLGLHKVIGYGNYTEEYSLLFNAIALWLFFSSEDNYKKLWKYFWIGVLFGLSYAFRANNIGGLLGILIAVFLFYLFKRNWIEATKKILVISIGFAIPLLLWTLYFSLYSIADDMIYASFIFNLSYSAAKERTWLDLLGGLGRYGMGWVGWFTVVAWIVFTIRTVFVVLQRNISLLEIFLVIWFPIEYILSNLSGRNFGHYYISWMLAVAIYCGYFLEEIYSFAIKKIDDRKVKRIRQGVIVIMLCFLLIISLPIMYRYVETINTLEHQTNSLVYIDPISLYVRENTEPYHQALTWYPDMAINFTAERVSPVKYLYYPLFYEGTLTEEIESGYIQDLITKHPEMIIDCSRQKDAIPSMHNVTRKEQFDIPGLRGGMYVQPKYGEIFDFVKENYHIETTIDNCIIFRLNQ